MATILNYRDIVLQATSPRMITVTLDPGVIVPATKAIALVSSSPTFLVTTFGIATPSSITLTATNKQVTGTISFSVTVGTATLTGSGGTTPATRTLTLANMTTNSITVRASVTDTDGTVYTSDTVILKVLDGQDGARGSITIGSDYYGWSVSSWNDQYANRLINNVLTGASLTTALATTTHLRIGDFATLSNTANTYRETRFWTGGSWAVPGQIFDGAVLVRQSVSATAIFTSSLSAITTETGTLTVGTSGYVRGGQTGYNTGGSGFYLGRSGGVYVLSVGDPSGDQFTFDGTNVNFVGSLTGTGSVNITGNARFKGAYTGGDTGPGSAAVWANESNSAITGVFGRSSATVAGAGQSGAGLHGYGSGTDALGVVGVSDQSYGVTGTTGSTTKAGVKATNTSTGPALEVSGKMTISNTTLVSNLNAEMWNGKKWNGLGTGAATGTLTLTNKPGAAVGNTWLRIDDSAGTLVGYIPFWQT